MSGPQATQRAVNDRLWSSKGLVKHYVHARLKPPEVVWLDLYAEQLRGKTLELGCGGGRFTGHLAALGGEVLATDAHEHMLTATRKRYDVRTALLDLHDLANAPGAPYDAIVMTANLLDVLSHEDRQAALHRLHDLLAPGGVLLFSTHNLDAAHLIPDDLRLRGHSLLGTIHRLLWLPTSVRNRRRLLPFEHRDTEFAVLNDMAHNWSVLHYYVGKNTQQRQLADSGFTLLSCLSLDGQALGDDVTDSKSTELHYAARRN